MSDAQQNSNVASIKISGGPDAVNGEYKLTDDGKFYYTPEGKPRFEVPYYLYFSYDLVKDNPSLTMMKKEGDTTIYTEIFRAVDENIYTEPPTFDDLVFSSGVDGSSYEKVKIEYKSQALNTITLVIVGLLVLLASLALGYFVYDFTKRKL